MTQTVFKHVGLVGCGLIGSSLARAIRLYGLSERMSVFEKPDVASQVMELQLADQASNDPSLLKDCDLIVFCTPMGAYAPLIDQIAPHFKQGAILTDVGSVKAAAVEALQSRIPDHVIFIPGHPIAGTENSGPASGFAELFQDRWFILTPLEDKMAEPSYQQAVQQLERFWQGTLARVATMSPHHHDRVLAMTSHLPHLIAYSIVDTATTLEGDLQAEVIQYSAGGFRDFTRIAASDPTMWRDIFLTNREAVLDMLQRFTEDLTELQKAIRRQDGDKLFDVFSRTRTIRRSIIDQKQHLAEETKKKV